MEKMEAIFAPRSVAVVGASTTPGKVGHDIFANILKGGYQGVLYPVNPSARSILSVRAYPGVGEIPDDIDIAINSGRTSAGAQAAASHTGALAGTEAVYDAIFEQAGVIRVNTLDELFDFANAFSYKVRSALGKMARRIPNGNRVAIVTNAIRATKLLKGFRGAPATDLEALQQALVRPSDLAINHPEIKELDINPLLVHPKGQGVTVADCRMLLAASEDAD